MKTWLKAVFAAALIVIALAACALSDGGAATWEVAVDGVGTTSVPAPAMIEPLPSTITPATTLPQTSIPVTPTPFPLPTWPTLGNYLKEQHLPIDTLSADNREQRIFSYSLLDTDQSAIVGYFAVSPDGNQSPRSLRFLKLDKTTNVWSSTQVYEPEHPHDRLCSPRECFSLGALMEIVAADDFYLAYMHLNPSAGWTLILTPDLELHDVLYGRVRGWFADGTAVYDESIIHFAPTHYALIDIYDPETKENRRIFPREPFQALWQDRTELIAQVYAELGETWCQENNHHCIPELFNNYLASDIVVNDETDSLAFVISFSSELSLELADETRAIYVYRNVHNGEQLDFREAGEDELRQLLGEFELEQLLEKENLALIFEHVDFIEH